MTNEGILKFIQRKYPVCKVIDGTDGAVDYADKCSGSPAITEVRVSKKKYDVTLCTGSFNVYVLKIEEKE